jgi:hypothetical protein
MDIGGQVAGQNHRQQSDVVQREGGSTVHFWKGWRGRLISVQVVWTFRIPADIPFRNLLLYPFITWDDVFKGRIHRTKGSKPFAEVVKDATKSSDSD